jgi:ribonuclease HI
MFGQRASARYGPGMSERSDRFHGTRDDLAEVLAGERRLADPAVRADAEALRLLLHPDFAEVGRSGARWNRDSIIEALLADPGDGFELVDEAAEFLAPGVVLVTYAVGTPDGSTAASRHSSIWVHEHGLWQARYHQGTPVI